MPAELDTLHPIIFVTSYIKSLTTHDAGVAISRGECLETPFGTCLLVAGLQLLELTSVDDSSDAYLKSLQKSCAGILGQAQPTLLLLSEKFGFHLQIAPAELVPSPEGSWDAALVKDKFEKEGSDYMKQLYGDKILRLAALPSKPEGMKCPVVVVDNLPKLIAAESPGAVAPAPASVRSSSVKTEAGGGSSVKTEAGEEETVDAESLNEVG